MSVYPVNFVNAVCQIINLIASCTSALSPKCCFSISYWKYSLRLTNLLKLCIILLPTAVLPAGMTGMAYCKHGTRHKLLYVLKYETSSSHGAGIDEEETVDISDWSCCVCNRKQSS